MEESLTLVQKPVAQFINLHHHYREWGGVNENTNGLIKQYFVKASSFENISSMEIEAFMNKLIH